MKGNGKTVFAQLSKRVDSIDWRLLAFLLLFLNVKLVIKVVAIMLIYLLRPDFKFGFRLKDPRLPLFYLSAIGIALFNWFISGNLTNINYGLVMATGCGFWILCILAAHQVKLAVERNDSRIIHQTILVFFIINIIASLVVFAGIVWETGTINPYRYQGQFQKYFIGTGDYIKGITMDTSTTNAIINGLGVIYFLVRKKYQLTILCMFVLLLTGSNISNLFICGTLAYIFLFKSDKPQKSIIVVCMMMLLVFLVKISPQNNQYIESLYNRLLGRPGVIYGAVPKQIRITDKPDSTLNADELKQKFAQLYLDSLSRIVNERPRANQPAVIADPTLAIAVKEKPVIPKPNIHTAPFQHRNDTTAQQKELIAFAETEKMKPAPEDSFTLYKQPGKLLAVKETFAYFKDHPLQIITGTGAGNFSSRLAFRATGLRIAGGYPARYTYISPAFRDNHLDLYLFYFSRQQGLHSLINAPNSTYLQLLGEYGLAGLACFFFLYLGFFAKERKKLTYGMPLLLMMTGVFFADYWFELLSAVPVFELLIFLDIKDFNTAESSIR